MRVLAAVLAFALAACGGSTTGDGDGPAARPGDVLFDEAFDLAPGSDVVADLGAADLAVVTTRSGGARVRVEARGRNAARAFERDRFRARLDGGRLVVSTERRSGVQNVRGGGYVVVVEVSEDVSVDAEVGSGDVTIGRVKGALAIDTGSGDVEAGSVGAAAEVETGSGDVRLGPVAGGADVGTGSGDVDLRVSASAPVAVETGSGDVAIAVPVGAGFEVSVQTGSGDVDIARDLGFRGSTRGGAEGRIGSGGPPLRVGTGSGDVSIRSL